MWNFPEFVSSIGKLYERFKNCNVGICMLIKMMIKKTINDTFTVRYGTIFIIVRES
jgi:hypothetical protein